MSEIKVSIIMPVYNSELYLEDCVDSILAQDFDSYELLLIDDGSSDGSAEICDNYAKQDSRIKVFHKTNGGICDSRNYGLERAQGEYIAFCDHDDFVEQGFLSENYQTAKQNNADIVKFGRKAMVINGDKVQKTDIRVFKNRTYLKEDIKKEFLQMEFDGAMVCVWDGFFRNQFLKSNHILFDTYYKKGGEDIAFCNACFARAEVLVLRDKVYYDHYIRVGYSTSTKADDGRLDRFANLLENMNDSLEMLDIDMIDYPELYLLNLMKGYIYPSLVYFISVSEKFSRVKKYLKTYRNTVDELHVSCRKLVRYNKKWGLYTSLFYLKRYRMIYTLLKFYKKKK